jgi:hypothetical protein
LARTNPMYPDSFREFLTFLCEKYNVDPGRVFVRYDSGSPPPLRGTRVGYYDGLLSYREREGKPEFLITVFKIAHDPLLTLGHEFAHLVEDLKRGSAGRSLGIPDESREKQFDRLATQDLAEFRARSVELNSDLGTGKP